MAQNGIKRLIFCPHNPEQDRVAERKHRDVETARTFLFNANFPLFLWFEAFMTFVFLINRRLTSSLSMQSTFPKIYEMDYDTLKVPDIIFFLPQKCIININLNKKYFLHIHPIYFASRYNVIIIKHERCSYKTCNFL